MKIKGMLVSIVSAQKALSAVSSPFYSSSYSSSSTLLPPLRHSKGIFASPIPVPPYPYVFEDKYYTPTYLCPFHENL
eukprot:747120-Hanusia_phi.AAC.5